MSVVFFVVVVVLPVVVVVTVSLSVDVGSTVVFPPFISDVVIVAFSVLSPISSVSVCASVVDMLATEEPDVTGVSEQPASREKGMRQTDISTNRRRHWR